jgi:hypothetical protein
VYFETDQVARRQFSPTTFFFHESRYSSQTPRNSREVGLEIKADKDKYVLLCPVARMQGKIATRIYQTDLLKMWRSSYFGATETNENLFSRK